MIGLATDYATQLGVVMEYLPCTLHALIHSNLYSAHYAHCLSWAGCYLAIMVDVAKGMPGGSNRGPT